MVSVVAGNGSTTIHHHHGGSNEEQNSSNNATSFVFDRVFSKLSTQIEVYDATAKRCVEATLNGINATVFAYGATGSGKTFTMIGNESTPGVMVLAMQDLFHHIKLREADTMFHLRLSYLEVYNETIHDLLVEHSAQLQLRDDGSGGTVVAGLSHQEPVSAEHVFALLELGNARRRQSPTDANAESSRSHAVLQIAVEQRPRTAGLETERRVAKLCMIDLAGSERAAASGNRGQLMREGANINKSLLALGNCINVLCQSAGASNVHVPYRDSKLTRLLKDSLGGNCRTVMIATISPSSLCIEDSLNTLRYANRAKNIKCNVQSNVVVARARVHEYGELISALRQEVAHWKARATGEASNSSTSHHHDQQQQQQQMHVSTSAKLSSQYNMLHTQLRAALARHKAATAAIRQQNWRERALLTDAQAKQSVVGSWQKRVRIEQASGAEPMTPPQIMRARSDLDTLSRNLRDSERERLELDQRVLDCAEALAQVSDTIKTNVTNQVERATLLQELEVGRAQELADAARDAASLAEQGERERTNETKALGQRLARALTLIRRQQRALATAGVACDEATCNELLNDTLCDSLAPEPSEFAVTQAPPETPRSFAKMRARMPARALQPTQPQHHQTSTVAATKRPVFMVSSSTSELHDDAQYKRRRGGIMAETAAQRARNEAAAQTRRRIAAAHQQQQQQQHQQQSHSNLQGWR
jgi:hypothetical protein